MVFSVSKETLKVSLVSVNFSLEFNMKKALNISVSEQILQRFGDLIKVHGIRNVTIDMIAEKCGISKKTVYKYFDSKQDMVATIINGILDRLNDAINEVYGSDEKPALKLEHLFITLYEMLGSISMPVLYDIKKDYPLIDSRIREFIISQKELITRQIAFGIETGDFYPDLNPDIVMEIAVSGAERIVNTDYILKHNLTAEQLITGFKNFMKHALIKK